MVEATYELPRWVAMELRSLARQIAREQEEVAAVAAFLAA